MKIISQLEEARIIKQYKDDGKTFEEIGCLLDKNGEACRSTLRRYESNLNNDLELLNILDNEIEDDYFTSYKTESLCKAINLEQQKNGYGTYFHINDLHTPFDKRRTLKQILLKPEVRKIKKCILNGDLYQMNVASKFMVDKDELIEESLTKGSEILEVLANEFEEVIVIEGNHDKHAKRELMKIAKNGLKKLLKDISPIQTVIDELNVKQSINNIKFTYGNELLLGNVYFAHPDYYASGAGQTVIGLAETYLRRNRKLSAVVIGHTHQCFSGIYNNIPIFENGCMCKDIDYVRGSQKRTNLWTTAYGIYTIKPDGNLDIEKSRVVPILNQE